MLSVDASDLDLVCGSDGIESLLIVHELWKLDVHGGSHGGTEVGWARGNVTEVVVVGELQFFFDVSGSSAESLENGSDVSSWLHRNDSELILFVDPDEEGLVIIVEDTSARWPVSVEAARLEESVSLPFKRKNLFRYNLNMWTNKMGWLQVGCSSTYLKRK